MLGTRGRDLKYRTCVERPAVYRGSIQIIIASQCESIRCYAIGRRANRKRIQLRVSPGRSYPEDSSKIVDPAKTCRSIEIIVAAQSKGIRIFAIGRAVSKNVHDTVDS